MLPPNKLKCGNFGSISVVFPGRSLDIYLMAECHIFVHPTWSWGERLYGIQPWRIYPQIIPEGWVRTHFPELRLVMVKCSQRSSWSSFIWQASIQTVPLLPWLLHWNFKWNQSMCHCTESRKSICKPVLVTDYIATASKKDTNNIEINSIYWT